MGELATLPVFLKLQGRRVVMAGGSEAAAWKAELFAAAGAQVEVFAPAPCEALVALVDRQARISIRRHVLAPADVTGAAALIADVQDDAEAAAFHAMARAAGVPVNVIDKPTWCDFQFGAIVERSPLVVAISTDGGAPVFGQMLRARIETLLPEGFRAWAQAARDWRPRAHRIQEYESTSPCRVGNQASHPNRRG
jgi:uroporphyrin-III C-methyltransferase/precorrin-2 dehydrogenase/sirohydrochlorin ferrochelatase